MSSLLVPGDRARSDPPLVSTIADDSGKLHWMLFGSRTKPPAEWQPSCLLSSNVRDRQSEELKLVGGGETFTSIMF